MNSVSSELADWRREFKKWYEWNPAKSLLASIRSYQNADRLWLPIGIVVKKTAVFRHRFWSVVTGADIPLSCDIGGGLILPHPNGIVIHPGAKIGPNCLIFQQVTIGTIYGDAPTISGHVDIGAGAKVLGKISIGENSKIGANAVVLSNIPANATAIGIPAKIHNCKQ